MKRMINFFPKMVLNNLSGKWQKRGTKLFIRKACEGLKIFLFIAVSYNPCLPPSTYWGNNYLLTRI